MRQTIFIKLMGTYFIIIVISLTVIGVSLSFMYKNYLFTQKEREMTIKGKDLAQIIKPFLVEKEDPHDYINLVNRSDLNLGTEVWVVDKKGLVIAAAANHEHCEGNSLEPSEFKDLESGTLSIRKGKSQFFEGEVIRVIVPILEDGKVLGGIIVYAPILGINDALFNITQMILSAGLLALLTATLIGFFLSKGLSAPILQISKISEDIAKGQKHQAPVDTGIVEVDKLSQTFNFMLNKLDENEQRMKDFVANVSHELRSPLTSIKGFVEALIDNKGKTIHNQQRFLHIINKEADRLSLLVQDLLTLSKADSIDRFKTEVIDLKIFLQDVVTSYSLRERSINLELIDSASFPLVKVEPSFLKQILVNLFDNAIKYSPPGAVIKVGFVEHDDMVQVSIQDQGVGIPEEDLPYIWDRFYRVDKARSRETGGTGLGLTIVKQLVEKHGGAVKVASFFGKGTTFSFTLPKAM